MSAAARDPNELGQIRFYLESLPFFALDDQRALSDLAAICHHQQTPGGQVVLEEGSIGDTMLVIVKGRVRIEKTTVYEDSYTFSFLETGDVFGELALLDRDHRSATCVAETDCEFLVIDRDEFVAFGNLHPAAGLVLTRRIAGRLADRLRQANEDILSLFTALVQEVEGVLR